MASPHEFKVGDAGQVRGELGDGHRELRRKAVLFLGRETAQRPLEVGNP